MKYFVYIIESGVDGSYYVGYTQGLKRRIQDHNLGRGRYSAKKSPWNLVYSEIYETKKEAIIRERYIKKQKSRLYIKQLITTRSGSSVG